MTIAFTIVALLLLTLIMGKINLAVQFSKEVKELFAQPRNVSGKIFHRQQLNSLPEPVQNYFMYILKDGQPYISYARITHDGQFKTGLDKNWINIKGEQYATMEKARLYPGGRYIHVYSS